ncbi:MAG: glycoside hydrolase family 31 protein [Proteobacteria bacterium]|nr:glycoside hydrolase family 31 protein [Pseudomonadota bacterium]
MRVRAIALAAVCALAACTSAAVAPAPAHGAGNQGIDIAQGGATIRLRMIAPGVLRVQYLPHGAATRPGLVIDPQPAAPPAFAPQVAQDGDATTMRSPRMTVTWNRALRELRIVDAHDHLLLRQSAFAALAQGRIVLEHAAGDALYGIGGYAANAPVAGLRRSGKLVAQAGKQGHAGAPFVWSSAGYGVLVDCDGAEFDLADDRIAVDDFKRPDADYYLLAGSPPELFGALAQLSGPAPMFPKWAMGFTNSQWGIDQKELLDIVATYRAKHIPIDNFTLDFDWKAWGQGDYGEFRWNPEKFPDGPGGKLAERLAANGMHLTGIMKPRLLLGTAEGDYATAHDLWIPGEQAYPEYFSHKQALDIDFDKPESRRWFGQLAVEYGFDKGIAGWWNDEADVYGKDGVLTSNTQFLNMQRALYDAQRAVSDERAWSINRNFWLGAQRYAYAMWSGDIDTGFASMAAQRARMLSAIDVGAMRWGMDGGGFNGHPSAENYARWIEFGAFTPVFRVHGTFDEKRQPWVYGPVAEAAANAAIRLRYSLIPYIYAYQRAERTQGVGLVRPLAFDWPRDANVRDDVDAWMFGQWLLVAPVVEQGQATKSIYLPAGTWVDWFTGKAWIGGQTIAYPVDAKTWRDIPLFIRAGAIIPTQPVMDFVGQHPATRVTVQVFPSEQTTQFEYYDDDGATYAYENGVFFLQAMAVRKRAHGVDFTLAAPQGSYAPAVRDYLLAIHGDSARDVRVNGKPIAPAASFDALAQSGGPGWSRGRDRYGAVTWVQVPAGAATRIAIESAAP